MKIITIFLVVLGLPFGVKSEDLTETAFAALLENATLVGTWAPIAGKEIGEEKADRYQIARAEPKGGENWAIVWKFRHQGRLIEYPIPAIVKMAGDVAILVLDDVPVGDGNTWSARVMFHGDTYTGRWWNQQGKDGTVSGLIKR